MALLPTPGLLPYPGLLPILAGTERHHTLSAFATVDDVEHRLTRDFSFQETETVELLLEAATGVITEAAGKSDAWAEALSPIPRMLRYLTVELVIRAMRNPAGVSSYREQLGAYSIAETYRDAADTGGGGLLLTKTEELLVRRVVYGRTSDSVKVTSVVDEICALTSDIPGS